MAATEPAEFEPLITTRKRSRGGGAATTAAAAAAALSDSAVEEDRAGLPAKRTCRGSFNTTVKRAVPKSSPLDAASHKPVSEKQKRSHRQKIPNGYDKPSAKAAKKPKGKLNLDDEDKRLAMFRSQASQTYNAKLERALTQPMYIVDRTRSTETCGTLSYPIENIELVGSTGNIYTLTINRKSTCDCPSAAKSGICKHLIYVMHRVLKAPSTLCHQASLTARELRSVLEAAPICVAAAEADNGGNRKAIEGDCPICFTEFEPATEEILYCRAACGNNVHRHCFEQWAAASKTTATMGNVRCPFCRAQWQGDEELMRSTVRVAKELGRKNGDGYVNVADQLGMSTVRDTSTYHQAWVNRQLARGMTFDDGNNH